ncbi:aaa domain-containing [Holotrichia oblita]|nr:aaa domain-containing [Holotrichia oblita]
MDLNMSLLTDTFDLYYNKAKDAHSSGKIDLAKRNYFLAAETMLKIAKLSDGKVKKARVERARRIIEIAETLKQEDYIIGNSMSGGRKASKVNEGGDDTVHEWQSANIPDISFDDIAGLKDVKKAITVRMINPLKHKEKYDIYDKKTGGGVLLYGPSGCGKTMIAKAIAHEVGAKFYFVKGSDIISKWVGDSEKNINALFETASKDALAIIFIDEMDSLIGKRGVDIHNDKRVNEFLQQIDGFLGKNPNLLLLGATNRPWDIDNAALRPGRFSQKIYVGLPDAPARFFLIEKYLKKTPISVDVSFDWLVVMTEEYSGADIEEMCDRAKENPLLKSIQTGEIIKLTREDFEYALRQVPPSVDHKSLLDFEDYLKQRIE